MAAEFDVVLYGATGFTGGQAARYFARHAPDSVRWAVAGRNPSRVEAVAAEVGAGGAIVADSNDPDSVDAMVRRARVVLTTAGPYSKYGTPVVESCVRNRADYVDITGETPWVRRLIDDHHEQAAADGTRIVPFCGFDSVPSDLGTLELVSAIRDRFDEGTRLVSASFVARGGVNGGTLDTYITIAERGERRMVADPVLLNPREQQSDEERRRSRDLRKVIYDPEREVWLAPFVMAPINTRVVRRSAALWAGYGRPYGDEFTYREAAEQRKRSGAMATALGAGAIDALVRRGWGRAALRRFGPDPGKGPSEKDMDNGFFRARLLAESDSGRKLMLTLSRQGDPGNRVTVPILCESALLLAGERDRLPGGEARGGVLTPATALGRPLLDRLERAGFELRIDERS